MSHVAIALRRGCSWKKAHRQVQCLHDLNRGTELERGKTLQGNPLGYRITEARAAGPQWRHWLQPLRLPGGQRWRQSSEPRSVFRTLVCSLLAWVECTRCRSPKRRGGLCSLTRRLCSSRRRFRRNEFTFVTLLPTRWQGQPRSAGAENPLSIQKGRASSG